MPRGGMKVTPAKAPKDNSSTSSRVPGLSFLATKPTRSNTDWMVGLSKPTFLSRNTSEKSLSTSRIASVQDLSQPQEMVSEFKTTVVSTPIDKPDTSMIEEGPRIMISPIPVELDVTHRPGPSRTASTESSGLEDTIESVMTTLENLNVEESRSTGTSLYSTDSESIFSKDSSSIYTRDSASLYSSASSIYSSGASTYSSDEYGFREFDRYARKGNSEAIMEESEPNTDLKPSSSVPQQPRARGVGPRRLNPQDAAARERSTLSKKAAMFKNSRLPPELPSFSTSLPMWSMICRALQASQDCYDSQKRTRQGIYTAANTSKDTKAMIIDDQHVDGKPLIIIAIRGTECQSLSDWAVNKAAKPIQPSGFLDDEENACHAGFLQVTKSMVAQVALQLQQHPATAKRPSLLFTGHSAGGAVAALLYSHMLSTTVTSELTDLASQFIGISCVTFGAPPLSLSPLPNRDPTGLFLAFANEGDPVLRLSDAAYVKSLAKLMTASPPPAIKSAAAPQPKQFVRGSRGSAVVYKQPPAAAVAVAWEDLPLWPTPPAPLTNAGEVVLLRDKSGGGAVASEVTSDDLSNVIFGDLVQHTIQMYIRRVNEVALAAMTGRV